MSHFLKTNVELGKSVSRVERSVGGGVEMSRMAMWVLCEAKNLTSASPIPDAPPGK